MAPTERISWTPEESTLLLVTLKEQKHAGLQSASGWKPQAWTACAEALKDSPGETKTAKKCASRFDHMKNKLYKVIVELEKKSGFGWNHKLRRVIATDEKWEELLAGSPQYKRWRTDRPWEHYKDMAELVDGIIATGAGSFRGGAHNQSTPADESQGGDGNDRGDELEMEQRGGTEPEVLEGDGNAEEVRSDTERTPQTPSNKRHSSSSEGAIPRKRRRVAENNAEVVSSSINNLASNLQSDSPKRRSRAIALLQEDADFSDDTMIDVVLKMTDNTAKADSFLAFKTKELRTKFASKLLS